MKMDVNKMMKQMQQMQAEMAKAQEELAKQVVEASAGGGMVVSGFKTRTRPAASSATYIWPSPASSNATGSTS